MLSVDENEMILLSFVDGIIMLVVDDNEIIMLSVDEK